MTYKSKNSNEMYIRIEYIAILAYYSDHIILYNYNDDTDRYRMVNK